ncbi:MAG: fibronectin type III domain-containing protein, partial [Endomicrobiia bacterium]|nr:fibronectin type III domain-containing protein [Endomicrobiia bacterium]
MNFSEIYKADKSATTTADKSATTIILTFLLSYFLTFSLSALEIGTPAGETGGFATQQKHFYGDYLSSGAPSDSVWSSSAILSTEALASGATSHFADMLIIPGNTFYYYLKTQSSSEQKSPIYRTVYVSSTSPGEVIVDGTAYPAAGLVASATVWHNFSDAPPPPANLTSFWSAASDFVSLEWDNPQFSGGNVLDLVYGGGYEIWRSSVSFSDAMSIISSVTAISGRMSFPDSSIVAGATYYYRVRAYDAYLPPMFSSYTQNSPASKRNYVTVAFEADVSALSGVNGVSVVGDFTSPPFYRGRLPMDSAGGGKWRLEHADASLYAGALIKYKYLVNNAIYEPDITPALGGPYRNVELRDEGSRRMTLKDV